VDRAYDVSLRIPPRLTCAALIFDDQERILLVRENYGRRRYGPPAGAVEAGETPQQAVVREVMEETCLNVRVTRLVALYDSRSKRDRWLTFWFRCEIEAGEPHLPESDEIAEVGWYDPEKLPRPLTHSARVITDGVFGEYGIVREDFIDD
jgi:ADP-ribose pyrophosphatase YjhB (NUDIX family)